MFCRDLLTLVRTAALCALIVILLVPTRALAMELKIVGNQLILSGPVVGDEPGKVREAMVRFAETEAERQRNGDPRPSLGETLRIAGRLGCATG